MEKVNRDGYYMGFDVETKAVGWAVTDKQYNLLRAKGRDLWGTRLFPPAETSEVRRGLRCSRRRIQREKRRLEILDDLFSDEIMKIDPGFFQRLKDSFLFEEDKADEFRANIADEAERFSWDRTSEIVEELFAEYGNQN